MVGSWMYCKGRCVMSWTVSTGVWVDLAILLLGRFFEKVVNMLNEFRRFLRKVGIDLKRGIEWNDDEWKIDYKNLTRMVCRSFIKRFLWYEKIDARLCLYFLSLQDDRKDHNCVQFLFAKTVYAGRRLQDRGRLSGIASRVILLLWRTRLVHIKKSINGQRSLIYFSIVTLSY